MRIKLVFSANKEKHNSRPNKHAIQGMFYKSLHNTPFMELHDNKKSKNFTFSDWLIYNKNNIQYYVIFSSPIDNLIKTSYQYFMENINKLTFLDYTLTDTQLSQTMNTKYIKTASPIVLVKDTNKSIYHSFKRKSMGLNEFDEMLKDSAIKRYRAFTGETDYYFDGPLFDRLEFRSEYPVPIKIRNRSFKIIGSTWKKLFLYNDKNRDKFYHWLLDAGLGQKTSMGFGFLEPYKIGSRRRRRNA